VTSWVIGRFQVQKIEKTVFIGAAVRMRLYAQKWEKMRICHKDSEKSS
jgi:hypothetical protein